MDFALNTLDERCDELSERSENEAETRHKIINLIIHDILGWPYNKVSVEEYIKPGFADFVLKKSNDDSLLFVEAKKSGVFFNLPIPYNSDETSCYINIEQLLSDDNINLAMNQVRTYCIDTGCEFAAITNGHEWIFFKTFEKGKRWEKLRAFVIRSHHFFRKEYIKAINTLSYVAITEQASLTSLLTSSHPKDRNIYYAKDKISSYGHSINANRLAAALRPIVSQYFGIISDDDTEFMDRCYVSQRDYKNTFEGVRSLIQDNLTPYFEEHGVQQLEDTGRGGKLGGKLSRAYKSAKKGEVLVLFGGKGAGKSTFIKRLLHHNVPPRLRSHSIVAIIDLLNIPEEKSSIYNEIWKKLVEALDKDKILLSDRGILIENLFYDRFNVAKKQELAGLKSDSEFYNTALNNLISKWKEDKQYCAEQLVSYWGKKAKGVIVVVDNTDQYSGENQDFCFTSAQEISNRLGCITLISMREERFYNSKIHGLLDAFQNSGFHISSPRPAEVFRKRLNYAVSQISRKSAYRESILLQESASYLRILETEFQNEKSPLNNFLSACAHGDTRLSLDLFRSFVLSGYTNVEEMLSSGSWIFQIHQVIKPVMIPTRFFYDEKLSDIPNIYQLRYNRHASHFTSLRILRKLSKNNSSGVIGYVDISELKSYFVETFNMLDDFIYNIDILLKRGFVEANNRLDEYSENVDRVKISSYGHYMLEKLSNFFTYIDLISVDCGVFSQEVSNFIKVSANKEYNLFCNHERFERINERIKRAQHFIDYLEREEKREREEFSLNISDEDLFTYKLQDMFSVEKTRILESARRQSHQRR